MTLAFEGREFADEFTGIDVQAARDILASNVLSPPIDVTPAGTALALSWRAVQGATGVRIDSSIVTVTPTMSGERDVGVVAAGRERVSSITVISPTPGLLVRSLQIPNLRRHDGDDTIDITSSDDLTGHRLVLTPIVGGQELAPIIAVPALGRKRALPAQLTGGSLSGSRLSLPDVVGDRFKVTVVTGDLPEEFVSQYISYGDVRMSAVPCPVGLHIDGPDGAETYATAGPIVARTIFDLSAAVQRHLDGAVAHTAPTATVTVRSDIVGSAAVSWSTSGRIERAFGDRLSVEATGSPASIGVPAPEPGRVPSTTTGRPRGDPPRYGICTHCPMRCRPPMPAWAARRCATQRSSASCPPMRFATSTSPGWAWSVGRSATPICRSMYSVGPPRWRVSRRRVAASTPWWCGSTSTSHCWSIVKSALVSAHRARRIRMDRRP